MTPVNAWHDVDLGEVEMSVDQAGDDHRVGAVVDDLRAGLPANRMMDHVYQNVCPVETLLDVGGETVVGALSFEWNKAPRTGMALPWHQDDGAFWGIDRPPVLQIWTALDAATRDAGCLEFVPGTHRAGLATELGGTVGEAELEAHEAERRAVAVEVEAGEALLIHNHVWHRSGPNTTESPRRGIGISYLDGATRCKRKKRAPRSFMPVFREALLDR